MVRTISLIATFLALGAAAGAPYPPSRAEGDGEHALRGRRTASMTDTKSVNCSSFKCSDGYILIENADNKECKKGKCSGSQCCDKVCSIYNCNVGYSMIEDANSTVCVDSRCTRDQCCNEDTSYCNSHEWSDAYALIENADEAICRDRRCTGSQCCDTVCSSFNSPAYCYGYRSFELSLQCSV